MAQFLVQVPMRRTSHLKHVALKLTGHKTRTIFDFCDNVNERDLADGVARIAALKQTRTRCTGTP